MQQLLNQQVRSIIANAAYYSAYYSWLHWWAALVLLYKVTPTKRPWESLLEINWLSLMELAFCSLSPFGCHYSPLSFLVLCISPSSSALRRVARALPPPAVGGCERFSNSQAAENWEGEGASAHHQGEALTVYSSTYLLSKNVGTQCLSFGHTGHAVFTADPPATKPRQFTVLVQRWHVVARESHSAGIKRKHVVNICWSSLLSCTVSWAVGPFITNYHIRYCDYKYLWSCSVIASPSAPRGTLQTQQHIVCIVSQREDADNRLGQRVDPGEAAQATGNLWDLCELDIQDGSSLVPHYNVWTYIHLNKLHILKNWHYLEILCEGQKWKGRLLVGKNHLFSLSFLSSFPLNKRWNPLFFYSYIKHAVSIISK